MAASSEACEDQSPVIAFLEDAATHGGAPVTRVETHGAIVFMAGETAYKMKKAVKFSYMDFSTLDRRKAMCAHEIELNRRTAPQIYRRIVAVTDEGGGTLALDGKGAPVEWLVEMARFDEDNLLDRVIAHDGLSRSLALDLAAAVARFHAAAEPLTDKGGPDDVAAVIRNNGSELEHFSALFPTDEARDLTDKSLALVARHAGLLTARRKAGFVRRCHGDLHPGNIVVVDGKPLLFDAIEFNDLIACIDVAYDLVFLLMELLHADSHQHAMPEAANTVLNGYLANVPFTELGAQLEALLLLPLFLSMRAAVRAHVSARMAESAKDPEVRRGFATAYFGEMAAFLAPAASRLIACGGLSACGKSQLAVRLAPETGPAPGAVVLRTDVIRKGLAGVPPSEPLPKSAYTKQASDRVYDEMLALARRALAAGHGVILDAVFADPAERDAAEALAHDAGVGFDGLWLDASPDTLRSRARARSAEGGDPSDADVAVVEKQLAYDLGDIHWHRIDANGSREETAAHARASLRRD